MTTIVLHHPHNTSCAILQGLWFDWCHKYHYRYSGSILTQGLDCFWFLVNILTVQCDGTFVSTSYLSCPQHCACVHAVSCWWYHRTPLKLNNKQEWPHHACPCIAHPIVQGVDILGVANFFRVPHLWKGRPKGNPKIGVCTVSKLIDRAGQPLLWPSKSQKCSGCVWRCCWSAVQLGVAGRNRTPPSHPFPPSPAADLTTKMSPSIRVISTPCSLISHCVQT